MKHEIRCNSGTAARLAATAATLWSCCNDAHSFCWYCSVGGHLWGYWKAQKLFAFEERVCGCCDHAEGRPLPEGEEEV